MQDQMFYTTVHAALADCTKIIDSLHVHTNYNSQRISLLTELKNNLHYSLGKSAYLLPFVQVTSIVEPIIQVVEPIIQVVEPIIIEPIIIEPIIIEPVIIEPIIYIKPIDESIDEPIVEVEEPIIDKLYIDKSDADEFDIAPDDESDIAPDADESYESDIAPDADESYEADTALDADVQRNIITALVEKLLQVEYNLDDKLQDLLVQEQTVVASLGVATEIKNDILKKYALVNNNEEIDAYTNLAESREQKIQSSLQTIRNEIMLTRTSLHLAHQETSAVRM